MRLAKAFYFLIALITGLLIVFKSLDYFNPDFSQGFLLDKEGIFSWYRFGLYAHIIGAPMALFTGLYQFAFTRSRLHPFSGKIYIASTVFLAAPGGLIMAIYAIGGIVSSINFIILSLLWFVFTLKAYRQIRLGIVLKHQQFMTRSFILANSAVVIRLLSFVNNHYQLTDVTTGYIIIVWLSWLPGLLCYELALRPKQKNL
jgi:uncharacterized membrane protein